MVNRNFKRVDDLEKEKVVAIRRYIWKTPQDLCQASNYITDTPLLKFGGRSEEEALVYHKELKSTAASVCGSLVIGLGSQTTA